jgi:hypothetical protein
VSPSVSSTISAIVSDSGGLSGGTLLDPTSGKVYGAFSTGGQGTFTFDLTWAEVNSVSAVNAPAGGTTSRKFTAKFFDNAGKSTTQQITINLGCDSSSGEAACGGTCTSLASDNNNCGGCGKVCASSVPSVEASGQFTLAACNAGTCESTQQFTTDTSCNVACASKSSTCTSTGFTCGPDNIAGYTSGQGYYIGGCSTTPPQIEPTDAGAGTFDLLICCCVK